MSAVDVRKVLVTSVPPSRELLDRAGAEGFGDIEFVFADGLGETLEEIVDADAVLVGPWTAQLLGAAKKLRWVHADRGGVSAELFPTFVQSPIPFTCLKPIFGIAGAEAALGAMLMFCRRLNYMVRLSQGPDRLEAQDNVLLPEELSGKTVGIVGLGHMGTALALRARSLGVRVVATARRIREAPEGVDRVFAAEELPELLGTSDFVVVSVPLTADTRNMVGESFLRGMKPTAFLIDLSGRPPIYNYGAVVRAIQEKWIAGVCLQPSGHHPDVGMPKADSPFWELDNVVVTPCRVTSWEIEEASMTLFFGNLRRLQAGQPLDGLVDKAAGY